MDIEHLLPWARRSAVVDFKQIEALSRVPLLSLSIGADNDLVRKGDPTSKCFIMMEGLACTSQTLADGRRQTTAMHVPATFQI